MKRLYEDEILLVDLPEPWRLGTECRDDFLPFIDLDAQRQLSVSIRRIDLSGDDGAQIFERLYEIRLMGERRELAADDLLFVEPARATPEGRMAFFSGAQRATGRVFSGIVMGRSSVFAVTYLETFFDDPEQHLALTAQVFRAVVIKG